MKKNYLNLFTCVLLLNLSAQMVQAQNEAFFNRDLNGTWFFRTNLYNKGEQEQWYLSTTSRN